MLNFDFFFNCTLFNSTYSRHLNLHIMSSNVFLHPNFKVKMEEFFELYQSRILESSDISAENGICRIWEGPLTKNGKYGVMSFRDPRDLKWKKRHAHRLSFMGFLKKIYRYEK